MARMGTHEGSGNTFWARVGSKETRTPGLISAGILWLRGCTIALCSRASGLRERAELLIGIVLLAGIVLLPFLGGLLLKSETHDPQMMMFLFSAFVISLLPAVVFLCLIGVVLVVPH